MSNSQNIKETTTCKFCNGAYLTKGWCPKYGLKFNNSYCIPGEVKVRYKEVKIRNNVPWWKFWKKHYDINYVVIV